MKATRILAIETSSARLSLAVGTEAGVLKDYQGPLAWRHAESLFQGMEKILKQVGWPVQKLTGVLVSTGPGSFTGIRIGLAAARALGQSLKIPVQGISSLETLAHGALEAGKVVCPVINALRGDVFTALYQSGLDHRVKTLWKERRLSMEDLTRELKPFKQHPLLFAGDAAVIYKERLRDAGGPLWQVASHQDLYPRAGVLLEIGRPRLRKLTAHSYQRVLPLYLRSAAAQERQKV